LTNYEQELITRIRFLETALKPLAAIADEYDAEGLEECRPQWVKNGQERFSLNAILYTGRGGKTLLTLGDAMFAREARTGKPVTKIDDGAAEKARVLFDKLYIGGPLWEDLPQERREVYIEKVRELEGL